MYFHKQSFFINHKPYLIISVIKVIEKYKLLLFYEYGCFACIYFWELWRREEGNRVLEVVSHHLGARIWIQVLWKGSSSFLMSNLYNLKGTFYVLHFHFNWENKIDDIQDRQKISVLSIYTIWRSKSRAGGTAHMNKVLAMQVQGPEFGALSLT